MKKILSIFMAVLLFASSQNGFAATPSMPRHQDQLNYIVSVKTPSAWACVATPRNKNLIPMNHTFSFRYLGDGRIGAWMDSSGNINGRDYFSKILVYGTSKTQSSGELTVILDDIAEVKQDPLPDGNNWSDVSGDVVELTLVKNKAFNSSRPYKLVGKLTTEYGIDDMSCIIFGDAPPVPRSAVTSISSPIDYLLSVKANQGHWRCDVDPAPVVKDSDGRILLRPEVYRINFRRLKTGQIAADIWSRPTALGSSYVSKFSKVAEGPRDDATLLTFKAAYNIERDAAGPLDVFWSDPFNEVFQINIKPNPRANDKPPYILTGAAQYQGRTWGKIYKGGETSFSCSVEPLAQ